MPRTDRTIRVRLLGRFEVEVGGESVSGNAWRRRRPIELLTAVALAPGQALHREELLDRLWPDKDLDAGANNLYRALHDLRRTAGAELLTIDRGVVRAADGVWIDVVAFEEAWSRGDADSLAVAVELYRGDLLPDDPYSDALAARREALRQRFVDAALRLATDRHRAGDREGCIAVLREALRADAALEPAHQMLMQVLAETGRAGDALRQFAECVTALRERLDASPSGATLELRAAIERGEVARCATRDERGSDPAHVVRRLLGREHIRPLHGRGDALAEITRFARCDRGVLLLVGESGLGKTRLAAECVRSAASSGATVLAGLGSDLGAGVPYAPFADAWADHRRQTGAPPTRDPFSAFVASGASAQEDRLRLFQSVEREVEALAANRRVCLVLEDLHLADESSLHLFHHLARATRSLPLLLVGTLREEEVRVGTPLHTLAACLGRERLATRVVLERLDRAATERLVRDLLGSASDDGVATAVHALTEGNPFYTEEVVRAMHEDGTRGRPILPADLLDTVRFRVRRLGRDAERLFAAAATMGVSFPFEVARVAADLEAEAALDALELGVEARIVEDHGEEVRFRHALTRQALLAGLTNARRVYLHRATADALEGQGELARERCAEALAFHLEAAGQLERALPYLLAAAARAQRRLGFVEAIGFLGRALELMDATAKHPGSERFQVLRARGGMRIALSDLDAAIEDLDAAAEVGTDDWKPTGSEIALVRRIAALALIQAGRLAEAGDRLERALDALGTSADDPERAAVLYLFAQLRWHEERYTEARELACRSLVEAESRADRRAMAKGHEMLALACHSLGEWQEGQRHERERQSLLDGSLDVDQAFDVHLCLWEYHLYGDPSSGAIRAAVEQTLEQARRMKAPRAIALCRSFGGTLDFQTGRWTAAEQQLREAVQLFRQVGSACGESLSLQRLGVLLTSRGQLDAARATLDEGIAVGSRAAMRSHCLTRLHASMTRNRLAACDRDGAQTSLQEGLSEAARHGHCATCSSLLLPEAVRVELAHEDLAAAEHHASRLERVAERFQSRAWTAMARHSRGRVLAARGRTDAALAALEEARASYDAVGSPYEAARCVMLQGQVLAAAGGEGAGRGRALQADARARYEALGAAGTES